MFYDYDGNLVCNPVMYMMALAFADNAFANDFTHPEQIYELVVPPEADRIRLQWKDSWAGTPIFRDVENTANGVRVSPNKPLQYDKHRHHFVRLGRTCGFEKKLEFYDLRRASGKELTSENATCLEYAKSPLANQLVEAVTPDERGQIMGQRDPTTYRRYYMPDFIDQDCQAIYLGTVPQDDLIRRVGRLPRDLRAPNALTDAQKFEIGNDTMLLGLYQKRSKAAEKIKQNYSTIKAAEGTPQHERYKMLLARINNKKRQLRDARLEEAIDDFFATINTEDVNKQLKGILPSTEVLTPSTIQYELEERATVAKLLFECHDDLKEFQMRMEIIRNLIILCRRQESHWLSIKTRHHLLNEDESRAIQTRSKAAEIDLSIPGDQMILRSTLYCPFCKYDEEVGFQKRNKVFARIDGLRKHVRVQHLEWVRPNEGFICPYQGCTVSLNSTMHFLSHTAREHGLHL